jgi:acyl carrier protein
VELILGLLAIAAFLLFVRWARNRKPPPIIATPESLAWAADFYREEKIRNIAARFILIIIEHSGSKISDLKPDTKFIDDLHLTDLEPVEILMATEAEFKIEFSESDAALLISVGRVIEYINQKSENENGA